MLRLSKFLFRRPVTYVRGSVGTGWAGLIASWLVLGGGVTLAVVSFTGMFTIDHGVCATFDDEVCAVANIGGAIAGSVATAVAILLSFAVARGFGPPAFWWALPAIVGGVGVMMFMQAVAGTGTVDVVPVVISIVLMAVATFVLATMLTQSQEAFCGWNRLDGLEAAETHMRGVDAVVFVAAAAIAASAGGAFALFMARNLTNG